MNRIGKTWKLYPTILMNCGVFTSHYSGSKDSELRYNKCKDCLWPYLAFFDHYPMYSMHLHYLCSMEMLRSLLLCPFIQYHMIDMWDASLHEKWLMWLTYQTFTNLSICIKNGLLLISEVYMNNDIWCMIVLLISCLFIT